MSFNIDSINWSTLAVSPNGNVVAAASRGGFIYVGSDSSPMTRVDHLGSNQWGPVSVSNNGTIVVAAGGEFASARINGIWKTLPIWTPPGEYASTAISKNGNYILVYNGIKIWLIYSSSGQFSNIESQSSWQALPDNIDYMGNSMNRPISFRSNLPLKVLDNGIIITSISIIKPPYTSGYTDRISILNSSSYFLTNIDASDNGEIVAGIAGVHYGDPSQPIVNYHLVISLNASSSFTRLDYPYDSDEPSAVIVSHNSLMPVYSKIYLMTTERNNTTNVPTRIFSTANRGASWVNEKTSGPIAVKPKRPISMGVSHTSATPKYYAIINGDIYESSFSASTNSSWLVKYDRSLKDSGILTSISFDRDNRLAIGSSDGYIYSSNNNGITWICHNDTTKKYWVQVSCRNPSYILGLAKTDPTITDSTLSLYKKNLSDNTWSVIKTGLRSFTTFDNNNNDIIVLSSWNTGSLVTSRTMEISFNGGNSWKNIYGLFDDTPGNINSYVRQVVLTDTGALATWLNVFYTSNSTAGKVAISFSYGDSWNFSTNFIPAPTTQSGHTIYASDNLEKILLGDSYLFSNYGTSGPTFINNNKSILTGDGILIRHPFPSGPVNRKQPYYHLVKGDKNSFAFGYGGNTNSIEIYAIDENGYVQKNAQCPIV